MKFEMSKDSLFAVLLRSSWWISFVIAAALFGAARYWLPEAYTFYAFFVALPFLVIAGHALWRQLRAPSAGRVADTLEAVRAMSWGDFSGALAAGFGREGYAVNRIEDAQADFELTRAHRVSLVGAKRWKVARTGVEPLRALHGARLEREAHECIYVVAGEITDNARAYATEKNIRLMHGAELVKLLPRVGRGKKNST
jgi:restriction system protein